MINLAAKRKLTATTFCYQRGGEKSESTGRTLVFLNYSYHVKQKKKAKGNSMVTILFPRWKLGVRLKFPFCYCCAPQSKEASTPSKWRLEFSRAILQSCCFSVTEPWGLFLSLQLNGARILISEICSTVWGTKSDCLYTSNDMCNS